MSRVPSKDELALADALVRGDGTPRSRETIVATVARALADVRDEGRREGAADARLRVLRESKAIVEGIRQDANNRLSVIEREVAEVEQQKRGASR